MRESHDSGENGSFVPPVVVLGHGDPFVKNAYLTKLHHVLVAEHVEHAFWVWSRDPSYRPPPEVHVIFRFGGWGGGATAIIGYLVWMALLLVQVGAAPPQVVFFCSRFDTAFPCAISGLVRDTSFVFLDRDTLSKSYKWPRLLKWLIERAEALISRRALLHVVPGQSRVRTRSPNVRIVRNTPHADLIREAKAKATAMREPHKAFTVLISGLVSPPRGAKWMHDAVEQLADNNIRFVLAGRLLGADAEALASKPNVTNYGLLNNVDALALTALSDIVWAFYDPSLEINRLAEPNKWFDCAALGVPFVTNAGLETSTDFVESGACFLCEYGDVGQLVRLTRSLSSSPDLLSEKKIALAKMAYQPWDTAMGGVVRDAMKKERHSSVAGTLSR